MISVIKNDEAAASLFKKASERLIFIQLQKRCGATRAKRQWI